MFMIVPFRISANHCAYMAKIPTQAKEHWVGALRTVALGRSLNGYYKLDNAFAYCSECS